MPQFTDCKFLVVDDMLTMRKMMTYMLKALNIQKVMDANDGTTAWDLIEKESKTNSPFHIVVSDWNMPNMLGIDLLKRCRSSDAHKNIGFILVTAEAETKHKTTADSAGVDFFLTKPVDDKVLLEAISHVFKTRFPQLIG